MQIDDSVVDHDYLYDEDAPPPSSSQRPLDEQRSVQRLHGQSGKGGEAGGADSRESVCSIAPERSGRRPSIGGWSASGRRLSIGCAASGVNARRSERAGKGGGGRGSFMEVRGGQQHGKQVLLLEARVAAMDTQLEAQGAAFRHVAESLVTLGAALNVPLTTVPPLPPAPPPRRARAPEPERRRSQPAEHIQQTFQDDSDADSQRSTDF